jgi:esterase/lipase superfamily enzyme
MASLTRNFVPIRVFWLVLAAALLAGCAPRGTLSYTASPVPGAATQSILVATTRNPAAPEQGFGTERAAEASYAAYDIAIPSGHEAGRIEWPGRRRARADRDFMVAGVDILPGIGGFQAALEADLARRPRGQRDVTVFVHGYNNTFAESLYRTAQIEHDLDFKGVSVLFAWPSAGSNGGYVYDRDSALYSRDGFEQVLDTLAASSAERIILVAHSMGAMLTVETLKQAYAQGRPPLAAKLKGVLLMSPDIDVDLFREDLDEVRPLPSPFVVFVSREDRALKLSALISGDSERLGSVRDLSRIRTPEVIVVDLSDYAEGGDWLRHSTFATSPALLPLMQSLPELDRRLSSGQSGFTFLRAPVETGALVRIGVPS